MILRPPRSTRTDTLFPYTTLVRSLVNAAMKSFDGLIIDGKSVDKNMLQKLAMKFVQDPTIQMSKREFSQRSEEHTSELQSLMRISYAVFCLKKKKNHNNHNHTTTQTSPYTQQINKQDTLHAT